MFWQQNEERKFQSTLPLWGATNFDRYEDSTDDISIHAPPVGSDELYLTPQQYILDFNPRSPCGERRYYAERMVNYGTFQSTLPLWGATIFRVSSISPMQFQSTLPLWGATSFPDRV